MLKGINIFLVINMIIVISACGGSSSNGTSSGGNTNCGNVSTSSYTINWNPIVDSDLVGYKIYYDTDNAFSKYDAAGFIEVDSANTSGIFTPSQYNIAVCTDAYFAISAVGSTRAESSLSQIVMITVD